ISAPVLQPGIKTKVGPGPRLPASTIRKEAPSPTSTFRSRTSEAEPARTAAAFAIIPAIKKTIGRGNKFTAKLISRADRRQRVECGSIKNLHFDRRVDATRGRLKFACDEKYIPGNFCGRSES